MKKQKPRLYREKMRRVRRRNLNPDHTGSKLWVAQALTRSERVRQHGQFIERGGSGQADTAEVSKERDLSSILGVTFSLGCFSETFLLPVA